MTDSKSVLNEKLNKEVIISREQASELVGDQYNFKNLMQGMKVETQEENHNSPVIQDVSFSIEKTKRARTIVYDGSEPWKCEKGQYVIRVTYDYKHPSNFALNSNNVEQEFEYCI